MSTPYPYTLKEWFDHTGYFSEQSLKKQSKTGHDLAPRYFRERYPDAKEASYKMRRFVAAQTYLDQHWDDFEAAGFGLASSKSAIQMQHVAISLYRFYSHAPDETLDGEPPPVELMIKMARENEESERN